MKRNTDNMEIKRRSTFAILFYINRTKIRKDGTCQLLCKISIDAKWEQIGTKVSVNPAVWNPEKGRADGRSENAITVNRAIDDLTKEIKEHYRRIKNSLGFITAEQPFEVRFMVSPSGSSCNTTLSEASAPSRETVSPCEAAMIMVLSCPAGSSPSRV